MDASVPIFKQTLGPLGLDVPPMGETGFEKIVAEYRARLEPEQGPVHIAGMTTMSECRAALLAVREVRRGRRIRHPCAYAGRPVCGGGDGRGSFRHRLP